MNILAQVISAVQQAGQAVLELYQAQDLQVNQKSNQTPVTQADLTAEKILQQELASFGYAWLSEESQDDLARLNQDLVWVVDPLDGTRDFIAQTDEFTIMVALVSQNRPILGVVYQPPTKTLYWAKQNQGAFKKIADQSKQKLQVSSINKFTQARILVSRHHRLAADEDFIKKHHINQVVSCGSAGLKACLVADGQAELYLNSSDRTHEWDICAADIIINEAGGELIDLTGEKFIYNQANTSNLNGFIFNNGQLKIALK
ncbi:MAG: 3'(2'),5'-bisphosphate nucleotidase CysQ [Candidatus Pacebacteria bacterium]|nr:3'(2'),5'-bisphosphate nucleotidase CysQ [Candidatus Paceibacterota bacterium]